MKALLMKIAAGTFVLSALFYFLACSTPTPNSNSSQNQNLAANKSNGNAVAKDMRACDDYGSNHGTHAGDIKKEIENKMSSSLKKLLKDSSNPKGTFTVEVKKASDPAMYYVATIAGKISGDDNLKELSDILNDFQSKQDCLRVIYFLPSQSTSEIDGPGFEWGACEYPLQVCPNGECCSANEESNSNSNGNSNANTNPITNANRGGNGNKN